MSVPQDTTRNQSGSGNKEQKVIVLSMKNMQSFKFDMAKSLLTNSQDNGHSVFNFKPQQLMPSPQIHPKPTVTNMQVVSHPGSSNQVSKIGTAGTILIRAQSPTAAKSQKSIQQQQQQQQLTMINHPNIKIQESPSPTAPGLKKISSEITMKNHAGHTVILQQTPQSTVKNQALSQLQSIANVTQHKQIIVQNSGQNQAKIFQIPCQSSQKIVTKPPVKVIQQPPIIKEAPKPIPILPKPDTSQPKIVVQQHLILPSSVIVQQSPAAQQIKSNVITIPATGSYKYIQQQAQPSQKWNMQTVSNISLPPALTPIQPKVSVQQSSTAVEKSDNLKILMDDENEEFSSNDSEIFDDEDEIDDNVGLEDDKIIVQEEKTPEKVDEVEFTMVKRIIEGEYGLEIPNAVNNDHDDNNISSEVNTETLSTENKCEDMKNITKITTSVANVQNNNNKNNILLCDEQITSVTPEESPETTNKSKDQKTPVPSENSSSNKEIIAKKTVEDVKKNLKLDLMASNDQSTMDAEENESEASDEQSNQNIDDSSSPKTSENVSVRSKKETRKRNRKPKNLTVIANLGLPYKPPQPSNRKKKVEKKVELEMDLHDPLNKILWEDGIGGLNNCNKLFGFNEFGLIEVLNKKDARAKLKIYDEKLSQIDDNSNFKFRKIVDPQDQFVCVICSKYGTVRDFFSPECCTESCFAITKRRTSEFATMDKDGGDSGHNTPTDAKKIRYDGEMVTLRQYQQVVLEQFLSDESKKSLKGSLKKAHESVTEVKFSWDSYLTSKSVPAPGNLFTHTSKTATTHFRVGMKLEAIDPRNQHMFCVCTVEEKLGCRMKLHFDGYPSTYDFWTNSDSMNIFPVGFCQSTGRKLNVPPRWNNKKFDWTEYFDHTNSVGAQRYMFPRLMSVSDEKNPLGVGMKLEVKHKDFWYAATIIDVLNMRILIRFDGIYENFGCFWFNINSPYINACDGHKMLGSDENYFKAPVSANDAEPFDWADYLKTTKAIEASKEFFTQNARQPNQFEPGMKLEVVDKINPQLIRPATILCQNDYKIQVIFDGFGIQYAYWLDDDSDEIFPINYCKHTDHPIEHPAGANKFIENNLCATNGCRGIGNALHHDRYFHDTISECPYSVDNWSRLMEQKENTRLYYKPYIRKSKATTANANESDKSRSLLLQNALTTNNKNNKKIESEVKKEEVKVKEEETTYETPAVVKTAPKKRGKKRKIVHETVDDDDEKPPVIPEDENDEQKAKKIQVVKHFLENYGPQLNYAYDLWTKNSKVLDKASITDEDLSYNPMKWNVDEVCTFLVKFCDEETTAKFYAEKIDGEALLSLCQNDLITLMNIKIGPAIKIYNRILWLRQEVMTKFCVS